MVAATFQRCGPLCSTVTYDLSVLQRAETNRSSLLTVFPAQRPPLTSFDIILVPDVLHTIWWGVGELGWGRSGLPPGMLRYLPVPRVWPGVLEAQRRLIDNLARCVALRRCHYQRL